MKDKIAEKKDIAIDEGNNATAENSKVSTEMNTFNLDQLRLSQDFSEIAGVKKALLTIPVRKPNKQEFIRVHPDENMSMQTAVLELKEERETYLVSRELWGELPGLVVPIILFTAINRQDVLTLWPVRLPGEDGRQNQWHQSALKAANMAKEQWIRLAANMSLGGYDAFQAAVHLPEPVWPDITFQKIMDTAFKDHFIQDQNHPVLRRLRGEM